jgi:hypothetical protein
MPTTSEIRIAVRKGMDLPNPLLLGAIHHGPSLRWPLSFQLVIGIPISHRQIFNLC